MRPERRFKGRNGKGRLHRRPKTQTQTPPDLSLLQAKNGLDNGVHLSPIHDSSPVHLTAKSRRGYRAARKAFDVQNLKRLYRSSER